MNPRVPLTLKQLSAALLPVCLVLAPSMAGGDADKDSVPSMIEILSKVSPGQPKALWQVTIQAQEADFIRFLSGDRILVGTVEAAGLAWGLEPREIIVLNARNGEKIWASPRKSFGFPQQLLATDPVILLQGTAKCAALNPKDGALVWERPSAGGGSLFSAEDENVIVFSRKKSTVSLAAIRVRDGSQVWTTSVEDYPVARDLTLEVKKTGQAVLLVGPELVAFSSKTGQTLWRKAFPGNFGPAATSMALGEDLYSTDGAAITRTDPGSGKVLWRREFPERAVRNLSMSLTGLLALLSQGGSDGSRDAIQALDRTTGKPSWGYELGEPVQSPMTPRGGRVYVTTATRLIGRDASNGSLAIEAAIPLDLQARRLLPDVLLIADNKIVLAREIGVMAVQERNGALLYAQSVVNGTPFTNDYTMHKLNRGLESATPLKRRPEFRAETVATLSQARYRAALDYQQWANVLTGAQAQAQTALQRVLMPTSAFSQSAAFRQTGVQAASTAAYTAMAAYGAAVNATMSGLRQERTAIMTAEVSQTFQSQANSVQGNLYMRPRYVAGRGWSVVLVELTTGKRAEVVLTPDNVPLARSAPNLPVFSVDPSGSRIVSKGLGLDPGRFQTYGKQSFTARRKRIWPHLEEWNIPYPSVLAFDLASVPFGQESESRRPAAKPVAPERRRLNDQLIAAAFECDLGTVRSALDAGADVNAVDEYGHTALMLATESLKEYKKKDVIAILLDRGADAAIKDPDGWTAADHFAIMGHYDVGGVQDSLDLLLGAEKVQGTNGGEVPE